MPYDGKLLARARDKLEKLRAANEAEHQRRIDEVYVNIPEIALIDRRMKEHMLETARLTLGKSPELMTRLSALKAENLDLQVKKAELLTQHGLRIDYLDEIVSCKKCRDTGVFESKPCECLQKLYNKELTKELGTLMRTGNECFERFDLRLYDAQSPTGRAPREVMKRVFEVCKKYAADFPAVSSDLLFQGAPGLGKTFLSACIARVVAEKGCSVCYDSAISALEAFEKQKFLRDTAEGAEAAARVRRMLDCDLMILDDLGTEMITPLSVSSLYTLINTRLVNGRRTIISTNLSDEDIQKNYNPQIASRLTGEYRKLPFVGKDIRQLRKS